MQYFHFLKIARLNAYYKETYNYSFQYLAIMIKVSLNKSIYNNFCSTMVQRLNSSKFVWKGSFKL